MLAWSEAHPLGLRPSSPLQAHLPPCHPPPPPCLSSEDISSKHNLLTLADLQDHDLKKDVQSLYFLISLITFPPLPCPLRGGGQGATCLVSVTRFPRPLTRGVRHEDAGSVLGSPPCWPLFLHFLNESSFSSQYLFADHLLIFCFCHQGISSMKPGTGSHSVNVGLPGQHTRHILSTQ